MVVAKKRKRVPDEDDEDDEEELERPKRKRKRRSKADTGGADLYRVALYQKIVLICVLTNIVLTFLLFSISPALMVVLALVAVPVSVLSSIAVFLLTNEMFGIALALVLGMLNLIPLAVPIPAVGFVGLIILLFVNGAATRLLKRNDLSVGLLGASLSKARRASDDESAGTSPAVIGGIVTLVILGALATWFALSGGLPDRVGSTSWPELQNQIPVENPVTLQIAGVKDKAAFDSISAKVKALADPDPRGNGWAAVRKNDRMVIQVGPVADPKAFAAKIDFGTVRSINDRIIRVDVP